MNEIQDQFYTQTLERVRQLTPQQWANVQQRVRAVRARLPRQLYLYALNSCIDLELRENTPPEPCPTHPVVTADGPPNQTMPCLPESPVGPWRQNTTSPDDA